MTSFNELQAKLQGDPHFTTSVREFTVLYLDTPMSPPKSAEDRHALKPGTCVKTREGYCGRVHKNMPGEICVVIGHGWNDSDVEKFVWRGTHEEFQRMWEID